ncbi:MAG: hypothetical protein J6T59_07305 [Bacteroidales bacterium]|nr:hypothetical protein [Bacteroidales bacterium]
MRKKSIIPQPVEFVLDVNDTFGCTTDYYLYLVKSELPPLAFANLLGKWLQSDFSYLQNYVFDTSGPNVSVPVFSATICSQNNLQVAIVPNKVQTQLQDAVDNFTLSIPLFDDTYYFLSNEGFFRYACPYGGYDYVLMAAAENDTSIEPFLQCLEMHSRELLPKDITFLLTPPEEPVAEPPKRKTKAKSKQADKQPLDLFLKSCCMELTRAHDNATNRKYVRFLGEKRQMPDANYPRKFKNILQIINNQMPELSQTETLVTESESIQRQFTREDI